MRLRWIDDNAPGETWRDTPTISDTTQKGDFAAVVRLASNQIARADAALDARARRRHRRGNTQFSQELQIPFDKVTDVQQSLAWDDYYLDTASGDRCHGTRNAAQNPPRLTRATKTRPRNPSRPRRRANRFPSGSIRRVTRAAACKTCCECPGAASDQPSCLEDLIKKRRTPSTRASRRRSSRLSSRHCWQGEDGDDRVHRRLLQGPGRTLAQGRRRDRLPGAQHPVRAALLVVRDRVRAVPADQRHRATRVEAERPVQDLRSQPAPPRRRQTLRPPRHRRSLVSPASTTCVTGGGARSCGALRCSITSPASCARGKRRSRPSTPR